MAEAKLKEAPADEALGDDDDEAGEEPAKKRLPLKLVLIAAVAAVLVLGGGGGAAFFLLKPKPGAHAGAHANKEGKEGKDAKGGAQVRQGPNGVVFYTLPDIVVNMQSADGRATYLKLKLTLELRDQEAVNALDPNMPRLQDMFQTFLRELRPEDLSGSQGSYQLRMEILRRVNLVIAPAKADTVLIEEMLIN